MDPFYKRIVFGDPTSIKDLRWWADYYRKEGKWEYIWHGRVGDLTPMEAAEAFASYLGWAPEEILALTADELQGAADILDIDPRDLSPYKLHLRYREADAISDTVGAIVREHDARRIRENRPTRW
jgi:hypothetical protein